MYCMKSTNFLYSVFLVITAVAGAWNLRQVMLTGQSNRLHRLLYKIMDEAAMKVRKAQQSGKNVSCLQCMKHSFYERLTTKLSVFLRLLAFTSC